QRRAIGDRRDGAAEMEPVTCRNVALGHRDETREPGLGGEQIVTARVENALPHLIADRQQLAVGVEQEAVTHLQRRRARDRFEGREARRQVDYGNGRLSDVTAMALDRTAHRRDPEYHVSTG